MSSQALARILGTGRPERSTRTHKTRAKSRSRRRRDAAGPATPPPPATPPFNRSQGVAITSAPLSRGRRAACRRYPADRPRSRRPRPPKRATGTFRGPRPLATAGGNARHQLVFPPAMAHLAVSLGRACLPPSAAMQDMDSVARNHLARCAGRRERPSALPPGPAEPLRGRSRQGPTALRSEVAPAAREPCLGHSRAKARSPPDGSAGSPRRCLVVLASSVRDCCPWPLARARRRPSWPPLCRAA